MNEVFTVPFAIGKSNNFADGYTLNAYTADEMIKVFVAQCFDVGIKMACKVFELEGNESIVKMLNKAYVHFVSSPCCHNPFDLAMLIYRNEQLVSELEAAFTKNIASWSSKYLSYGIGYVYSDEQRKEILANNYAIKSVLGAGCVDSSCAFGGLSKALMHVMLRPNDQEIKKLFSMVIASEPMVSSEAEIVLRTLGDNATVYINYYYATLLNFCHVSTDFDSVLREVRAFYGL